MAKNLLFLHGLPNNGNMWKDYKNYYTKLHYNVYTPTLPFVYSNLSANKMSTWIYNYINKNIKGEIYAIIMHDLGAIFGWPLILNNPNKFIHTKIITLSVKWEQHYPNHITFKSFYMLILSIIYYIYCIYPNLGIILNKKFFSNYLPKNYIKNNKDMFSMNPNANYLYVNWIFVPFKNITGYNAPTNINRDYLFIYSEDDKFFNSIPNNNKKEILLKNCGHWFPLTHKKIVIGLIDKYIL